MTEISNLPDVMDKHSVSVFLVEHLQQYANGIVSKEEIINAVKSLDSASTDLVQKHFFVGVLSMIEQIANTKE